MTEYALRYYQKENKFLVEIKDSAYFELDKQIRRIAREYDRISNTDSAKKPVLEAKRKELRSRRQEAMKCYWISESDIPAGMSPRPIYKLPPVMEELPEAEYIKLLAALRREL